MVPGSVAVDTVNQDRKEVLTNSAVIGDDVMKCPAASCAKGHGEGKTWGQGHTCF